MKMLHERYGYIADPHTAVGVLGWEAYKREHSEPAQGLVLATAHPAKFADVVMKAIGTAPPLPDRLAAYLKREKLSLRISSAYDDFKQFLLAHSVAVRSQWLFQRECLSPTMGQRYSKGWRSTHRLVPLREFCSTSPWY